MIKTKLRVAVGLSGGVDSSVAALKLIEAGYEVVGVHMVCWDYDDPMCHGKEDRTDAVKVAAALEIPFKELNFVEEYKKLVLDYFFSEVRKGRTPNPDVMCNKEIKFGLFMEWALQNNFDYVATGHYAKIEVADGVFRLRSGFDAAKDQSYFLYRLTQSQLSRALFPLGELTKAEIRKIASTRNFVNAEKPDSTGICFVGDIDIKEFIKRNIAVKKGIVVNDKGEEIGEHDGVELYTIGQRHGFRLTKYQGMPLYVIEKKLAENKLIVAFSEKAQFKEFEVTDISFIDPSSKLLETDSLEALVRIRNLGDKMKCQIVGQDSIKLSSKVQVTLSSYALGVAPGQSAVFYDDNGFVIGGGTISQ